MAERPRKLVDFKGQCEAKF